MSRRFIITILTLLVIAVSAAVAIFLAKGFTFNASEKRIVGTGIITITSVPDAASVYIDGHLTTATNATISSLPPKEYSVKVVKEGFIAWEKKVSVKEGLVSDLKVTLFPSLPTIYPLTFTGVKNPVLSPDSSKLAYIVPVGKKKGIWVWTLEENRPIAFTRGSEPHQITELGLIDYSEAILRWSADSNEVLATVGNNNYLLRDDGITKEPRDITPSLQVTLKSWEDDQTTREQAKLLNLKDVNIRKIASSSAVLKWSPDETKFLYRKEATKGDIKVYDLEEKTEYKIPEAKAHLWLPDSRHIILVDEDTISVVDFDGINKAIIYGGKFEQTQVYPWPDSSKLVIVSSFPTPTASEPNLYGINLK